MTSSYIEVLLHTEPVNKKEEVGCKDASPLSSMAAFLSEPGLRHPTAEEFCLDVYTR
jgi:hypothetical protein